MDTTRIDNRISELRDGGIRVDTSEPIDGAYARDLVIKTLGIELHDDYVRFVQAYGTILCGCSSVAGLFPDEVGTGEGCVVYETSRARRDCGLPPRYLALHVDEDGEVVCLGPEGAVYLWERGEAHALYGSLEVYLVDEVLKSPPVSG